MRRAIQILTVILMLLFCAINAKASESIEGAKQIKATAYCLDGITASGQEVREGICAGPSWMVDEALPDGGGNWVAMLWTSDGTEFLGYYEVTDKGGTDAIRNGYVIDVWKPDYESCKEFMALTQGKVLVKYVWSVG